MLAYLPPEEIDEIIKKIELFNLTDKTITSKEILREELCLIRLRGWSTSFGERIDGVSSLSVPVTNSENKIVASLNILGPYIRLGEERLMQHLDILKDSALSISNRLGYYGDG